MGSPVVDQAEPWRTSSPLLRPTRRSRTASSSRPISARRPPRRLSPSRSSTSLAAATRSAAPSSTPAGSSDSSRWSTTASLRRCGTWRRCARSSSGSLRKTRWPSTRRTRTSPTGSSPAPRTSSAARSTGGTASASPVGDTKNNWPDKPQKLREVVEKFVEPTRGVGMELLRLLCEGMGLRPDYFEGDLTGGDVIINVNHYPPCPAPGLTLGLPPHCDRNLITLLLQSTVPGLQVSYKGDWINVESVPDAFVVNFGHLLEIATNGFLKSIEHRAMTNAALARTSVATFIMPAADIPIGPAEELVGEANPPRYRTVTFDEFMRVYKTVGARRESVEKAFKL